MKQYVKLIKGILKSKYFISNTDVNLGNLENVTHKINNSGSFTRLLHLDFQYANVDVCLCLIVSETVRLPEKNINLKKCFARSIYVLINM